MKFTRLVCTLILGALMLLLLASPPAAHLQRRPNTEQRINQLLARMTLAEKLGQLQPLDGHSDGRFKNDHPDPIPKGRLGSTLTVRGARNTTTLQRIAMNEPRLKIPVIF